jgi:hypothetical protein
VTPRSVLTCRTELAPATAKPRLQASARPRPSTANSAQQAADAGASTLNLDQPADLASTSALSAVPTVIRAAKSSSYSGVVQPSASTHFGARAGPPAHPGQDPVVRGITLCRNAPKLLSEAGRMSSAGAGCATTRSFAVCSAVDPAFSQGVSFLGCFIFHMYIYTSSGFSRIPRMLSPSHTDLCVKETTPDYSRALG